jgi:hypothetical protein
MWDGPELKALTQVGRVTILVLLINDPELATPCGRRFRMRVSLSNKLAERCIGEHLLRTKRHRSLQSVLMAS